MEKFKNALLFFIIFIITSVSAKMIGKNFIISKEGKTSNVNNLKSEIYIHDIEKEMLAFVNIANQQLPRMIDKDTRLESVFCDQKNFVIKYTLVNQELSKIDVKKFNQVLEEKITKNICIEEDNKKFLESGVGYYFTYFDNKGDYISKIFINKNDCSTDEMSKKLWKSSSGNFIAIFPQQPDLNSIQTEYGVINGYSCNEKVNDSYIMYSITEFPKYSKNNKKLAEMTIRDYLNSLKKIKMISTINWLNYSNDELRGSYEFSYVYQSINAIEKGFMSIHKDNMVRVSFTLIDTQDETIINKGNNFLNSFKFLTN